MKTLATYFLLIFSFSAQAEQVMPFSFMVEKRVDLSTEEVLEIFNKVLQSPLNAAKYGEDLYQCIVSITEVKSITGAYFAHAALACEDKVTRTQIIGFIKDDLSNYTGLKLTPSVPSRN